MYSFFLSLIQTPGLGAPRYVYGAVVSSDAPEYWQTHFQDGATRAVLDTYEFYGDLASVMVLVAVFVAWLAFRALWQFSAFSNKQSPKSRFQHHTDLEVWWTLVPTFILLWIAAPSLTLLYATETTAAVPTVTVRAIGRQWYWSYEIGDYRMQPIELEQYELYVNPLESNSLYDLKRWERRTNVSIFDYLNRDGTFSVVKFCQKGGGITPSLMGVFYLLFPDGPVHNDWTDCLDAVTGTVDDLAELLTFVGDLDGAPIAEEVWKTYFLEHGVEKPIILSYWGYQDWALEFFT